ncbi:MAG: HipA domain-containing protein [Lachnospiraceae bacterium]|nr:HipA domain-containing protein [Lachnospiraceae bacterium]
MNQNKQIYVNENWKSKNPSLIGKLYVDGGKGRQIVSFEYAEDWINDLNNNVKLDPDFGQFKGRQYCTDGKNMFGIFEDSCPDRWGRLLMKRREAILAKKEERKPKKLTDIDFLLGVYDETRMGGLRFQTSENGDFLSNDKELATPPWATLRKLETASLAFEKNDDGMEEKWLKQLLAPGSSLGGARPKASVLAPDDSLWIAKFPSKHDETNTGAWEMVVHDLAILCGLDVPEAKLENFSKAGSTFLVKRFDRAEGHRRIHFVSAMTLLGKKDGVGASEGVGYLNIASIIRQNSTTPKKDLQELWNRIIFNMAVSNTDDHLRNHGFILKNGGYCLSPLFDVNPNIYGDSLSLNVDSNNNQIDFSLALSVAKLFDLKESHAESLLKNTKMLVEENWKKTARKYGLSRSEIENMSPAFDMKYK